MTKLELQKVGQEGWNTDISIACTATLVGGAWGKIAVEVALAGPPFLPELLVQLSKLASDYRGICPSGSQLSWRLSLQVRCSVLLVKKKAGLR